MQNVNPKEFVANLELAYPKFAMESLIEVNNLKRAFESGEKQIDEAYFDNKSVISFVSNVSGANRQDVLNSTLIAQLAANKKFPNHDQIIEWYGVYVDVLSNIGWSIQGKDFSHYETTKDLIEIENVIIDIITSAIGGNFIGIITQTLTAIKNLSNTDNKIIAFEKNTHSLNKGSFQVALAVETNGQVSMGLGGFMLSTENVIKQILIYKSSKSSTELDYASMQCTLNTDTYALVRKDIIEKLGEGASKYIAEIEI